MARRDDLIHLLLANAGDRRPALPDGLPLDAVTVPGAGDPWRARRIGDSGGVGPDNNDDIPRPRPPQALPPNPIWGIIAPEGAEGDRLIRLVEPLIAAREAAQGVRAPCYRVPKGTGPWTMNDARAWRREVYDQGTGLARDRATVQLVLGDFVDVPFVVQQAQSVDAAVGRLAFDDDAGYESYVAKVLAAERGPRLDAARVLLHTAHDGSPALDLGMQGLAAPGEALLRSEDDLSVLRQGAIVSHAERGVTGMDLLLERAADPALGVLFTLSHGLGAPQGGWPSPAAQRADQGAMSFGFEGQLSGRDLATVPFMPGGLWLMFACFGAGTPESSAYESWLTRMESYGRRRPDVRRSLAMGDPFVSDLPKRVLANPKGPLGFVGHVDLAWAFSFRDEDDPNRPRAGRFMRVLASALAGNTLGAAFYELARFVGEVDGQLTSAYAEDAPADKDKRAEADLRRALLWMARQDLAGFILLGDPGARLPVDTRVALPMAEPPPPPDFASSGGPIPDNDDAVPAPLDRMERIEIAVGAVLARQGTIEQVAATHGMSAERLAQWVAVYRSAGRAALRG